MSFNENSFYRLDTGFQGSSAPKIWGYTTTVDIRDAVAASGYFPAKENLNVGDVIYCKTSDGVLLTYVTSATAPVTTGNLVEEVGGPYIVSNSIYTTTGGSTDEEITGDFESTDVVQVTMHSLGASQATIDEVYTDPGKVTIAFSGDPGADTKVNLTVVRG